MKCLGRQSVSFVSARVRQYFAVSAKCICAMLVINIMIKKEVLQMKLAEAKQIAKEEIAKHNLDDWNFEFNSGKRRFGVCRFALKTIGISKHLTLLNGEDCFRHILLHEIAHALVGGGNGHNHVWRSKAISIGCDGERLYSKEVVTPPRKHVYKCTHCSTEIRRHRRINKKTACARCCELYNGGKFTDKYLVVEASRC